MPEVLFLELLQHSSIDRYILDKSAVIVDSFKERLNPFLDCRKQPLSDLFQFGRVCRDAIRSHFVRQKINLGLHGDTLVKLLLMLHSVNRTYIRSSVARHSSKLVPPKQMSSSNDLRQNTGVTVNSSTSPLTNMLFEGSSTNLSKGSTSLRGR